jgi:hypothetical protein
MAIQSRIVANPRRLPVVAASLSYGGWLDTSTVLLPVSKWNGRAALGFPQARMPAVRDGCVGSQAGHQTASSLICHIGNGG